MKRFKYEIGFHRQASLVMDIDIGSLSDAQRLALSLLRGQGFRCTITGSTRVEDLPLLHYCVVRTARQLGIPHDIKILVPRVGYDIYPTYHECVSEIWRSRGTPSADGFRIPCNIKNIEALMAIVRRLKSLQEVIVYDDFEDTIRELAPESVLTYDHFLSDLDAVSLKEMVSFRWENIEACGTVSSIRQVLRTLDDAVMKDHPRDKFTFIQLIDCDRPSIHGFPMRGNDREFYKDTLYAEGVRLLFHDYFPPLVASDIMDFVDMLIRSSKKKYRRKVVINVGICDGELRVEPPDTVWIPSHRLHGRTSLPTLALAATHVVKLLDVLPPRRSSSRRIRIVSSSLRD
jgi:hypothetical protein